jgi:hypothetical protein
MRALYGCFGWGLPWILASMPRCRQLQVDVPVPHSDSRRHVPGAACGVSPGVQPVSEPFAESCCLGAQARGV